MPKHAKASSFRSSVCVMSTNQFGANQLVAAGVHSVLEVGAYVSRRRTGWSGMGRVATATESNSARWSWFTSGCAQ